MSEMGLFDIQRDELRLCALQYVFVKIKKGTGTLMSEGCISFANDDGYFAALGHGEDDDYLRNGCIELFAQHSEEEEPLQAGWIMHTTPFSVYGCFYEDYIPPVVSRMKVAPANTLEVGPAELWMPFYAGKPRVYRLIATTGAPHSLQASSSAYRWQGVLLFFRLWH